MYAFVMLFNNNNNNNKKKKKKKTKNRLYLSTPSWVVTSGFVMRSLIFDAEI